MQLILNYKNYEEAMGENAVNLTKIVNIARQDFPEVTIVITPQTPDIYRIREHFPEIEIWAQHIDPVSEGKHTGWASMESVIMAGATGSLLNHSERPVSLDFMQQTVPMLRKYQLQCCAIAADIKTAKRLAELKPDMIAFEPPELISTSTSLIDTDIELAQKFVDELKDTEIPLLLGAGVREATDVSAALKLGYNGVLLSSGFVKADDPKAFLEGILQAYA